MRSMSIYELNADYVKYARFLGIKDRKIVGYVFRNAMLPQITGLALSIGTMVGGALVAEIIFSYPGLGTTLLNACHRAGLSADLGIHIDHHDHGADRKLCHRNRYTASLTRALKRHRLIKERCSYETYPSTSFSSGKFMVGFIIFMAMLLIVIVYPLIITDPPLGIIGQGTFFPPGIYVNVYDSIEFHYLYP